MQASHPHDRLRIIHTHQKRYQDAIRVCQAYLDLPDRECGQDKEHFRHHLERPGGKGHATAGLGCPKSGQPRLPLPGPVILAYLGES